MSDSLQPHGILQARILEWVAFPFSRDLPNPGIEPRLATLQVDSLPAEPQGKPKNTGVGSLSLPQGIFPTQESNQALLHCRWLLYQLSYQGSPKESESCSVLSASLWSHRLVLEARLLEWVAFSFLQQIFPTQESNRGLLHCRRIFCQLSYQGSPCKSKDSPSVRTFVSAHICPFTAPQPHALWPRPGPPSSLLSLRASLE